VTPALLDGLVRAAACEVLAAHGLDPAALPAEAGVARSRRPAHGEYASTLALRTAGRVGVTPRELAGWLASALAERPEVADADVAGPGFLNLRLTAAARGALVAEVLSAGDDHGTAGEDAAALETFVERRVRAAPELIQAVGADAARYALARSPEKRAVRAVPMRPTLDNPLFRVQYAHARAVALARNAADLGVQPGMHLELLTHPCEGELIGIIGEFPAVVRTAAASGEPHRVTRHLEALADAFLDVHDTCRVLPRGDEEVTELHRARLATVAAARQVLANGLGLLGVAAPERI
jgi:arginyl-tRNA synthetase